MRILAGCVSQVEPRLSKTLGTADADALRLEAQSLFNVERLYERAVAEHTRREAAGISDSVEAAQPQAPAGRRRRAGLPVGGEAYRGSGCR